MKTGLILYLTEEAHDRPRQGVEDLIETSRALGVSSVSVAVSQEDVACGWAHLVAEGIQEVLFMTVSYDAAKGSFVSCGAPLRLCG